MTDVKARIHIVETLIGVFGVTERDDIIEGVLYPRDAKKIAAALEKKANGELSREVSELVEKLRQRGFKTFVLNNHDLAEALREKGFEVEYAAASDAGDSIRGNLEEIAVERGMIEDASQFYALSQEVSVLRTKRAVRKAQAQRDAVISQTVQLLNELDKTLNVLSGKLREWYGLHFPELDRLVKNHRNYSEIVSRFGDRGSYTAEGLEGMGLNADVILGASKDSMGAPLLPGDADKLKRLAENLLSLYSYRVDLEAHI
ncbi:MAG: hypothetical protein PVJ38_07725, partial [Candidatus Bathyarchaeota archaeon]